MRSLLLIGILLFSLAPVNAQKRKVATTRPLSAIFQSTPFILSFPVLKQRLDTSNSENLSSAIDLDDARYYTSPDTVLKGIRAWMIQLIDTLKKSEADFSIDPEIKEIVFPGDTMSNYLLRVHTEPCFSDYYLVRVRKGKLFQFVSIGFSGCAEGGGYDSKAWLKWNTGVMAWDVICLNYSHWAYSDKEFDSYESLTHHVMLRYDGHYEPIMECGSNYVPEGFFDKYLALLEIRSGLSIIPTGNEDIAVPEQLPAEH